MTYQPVVPFNGYSGWLFLNRTRESQQEAFDQSASVQRNEEYFRENIAEVTSAEQLVSDRQLLEVALGAFGLDEDIDNKYFIQKILEDGSLDDDALANKLTDKRYLAFTQAFGFGDFSTPRTSLSEFPDEILSAYKDKQFEIAVGNQDADMRLALGLDRELSDIASLDTSEAGMWFSVMGNTPVRTVFETALNLPTSVGALNVDKQLEIFQERAEAMFGSSDVAQFADAEKREDLVQRFLMQSQINAGYTGYSSASAALTLLQSSATIY